MANVAHLIIAGMGRSGSTLLLTLMQSFKGADVWLNERTPVRYKTAVPVKHPRFKLFDSMKSLTITKRPADIHNVERMQNIFTNPVGFILLKRDPRDVIVSKLFDKYWVNCNRCKSFFINLKKFQDREHVLTMAYEDLVRTPNDCQQTIASFFDIKCQRTFTRHWKKVMTKKGQDLPSRMHAGLRGIRPISPKSIGSWKKKEHRERVKNQLERCPGLPDLLIQWGYEKDKKWLDLLSS